MRIVGFDGGLFEFRGRFVAGLVERPNGGECISEPECPHPCRCADGIVDCREKALTKVPDHLPDGITEL